MIKNHVCLFFYVHRKFLIHGCELEDAERYGDFLIYPESHFDIWEKYYSKQYGVDFDFFPRGRVAYRRGDNTFLLYYDRCIGENIHMLVSTYDGKISLGYDEHYRCHKCNPSYIV